METEKNTNDDKPIMTTAITLPELTTDKTIEEIYKITQEDRQRAIEAYEEMKENINKLEKLGPGAFEALNSAQQLIQTSTDKLINLVKLMSSKENAKSLNQFNFNFDDSILEDGEKDTFETRAKKMGVKKR